MMNVKKLLKIEYILIYLSIFVFILNVSFKRIASNEFDKIDLVINLISLQNKQPEDFRQLLLPFSYFDQEIETQLNEVLLLINDPKHHDELIEATIQLQYSLRQAEQNLLLGYDCLLYCALFLAVIAVLVILYKNFSFKMESNRRKAMNDAQINFSRDLHDGVAQDLAAMKVYLKKNDVDKTNFYANQAFKEVRYLIDSLRMDFNGNFEKVLEETINSFEDNYEIKAKFLCATEGLNKLKEEQQIEIYRVLQEALSNIARHANATEVTVKITEVGSNLNIIISDNGTGFNQEEIANKKDEKHHYGLINIKDRVNKLGGTVDFVTTEGTTIAITIKDIIR